MEAGGQHHRADVLPQGKLQQYPANRRLGVYQREHGTFGDKKNVLRLAGFENQDTNLNVHLGHHTCPLKTVSLAASKLARAIEKQLQRTLICNSTCLFVYVEIVYLDSKQICYGTAINTCFEHISLLGCQIVSTSKRLPTSRRHYTLWTIGDYLPAVTA
jgi:hypothetical protein